MQIAHRVSRTLGAAGLALGLVLWMEQQWAAHHDFPSFPDLDPSGVFGADGKPIKRIALVGDSTITGPGLAAATEIWIRQMLPDLISDYRTIIDSYAVGGARLTQVLTTQVPRVGSGYDVAVVSAGSNDALRGMTQSQMVALLGRITDELSGKCAVVVLAGAGDIGTAPRLPFPLSLVATARARVADHAHAVVAAVRPQVMKVPMWDLTTHRFRTQPDLFSPDRFHPNVNGHAIWAEAALPTLQAALRNEAGRVPSS